MAKRAEERLNLSQPKSNTSRWSDVKGFAFLQCKKSFVMWWTVPAPSNEVP